MKNKNDRVVELMREAIETRIEREKQYKTRFQKSVYKQHGELMKSLFPDGIYICNEMDQNRFMIFGTIANKLLRYANNFYNGGHDDSLKDISVYANMLRELDEIKNMENKKNESKAKENPKGHNRQNQKG